MLVRGGFLNEPEQRRDWIATVLSRYATFVECNLYSYLYVSQLRRERDRVRRKFVPRGINWKPIEVTVPIDFDWKWLGKRLDDRIVVPWHCTRRFTLALSATIQRNGSRHATLVSSAKTWDILRKNALEQRLRINDRSVHCRQTLFPTC